MSRVGVGGSPLHPDSNLTRDINGVLAHSRAISAQVYAPGDHQAHSPRLNRLLHFVTCLVQVQVQPFNLHP